MKSLIGTALVVASSLVAGTALATIPDAKGIIHGCYDPALGVVRVINAPAQSCQSFEKAISWDQSGAAGPAGAAGATGAAGPAGAAGAAGQSVVGQSVAPGDPNCPAGGAMFSLGSVATYVCNGAQGVAGAVGPVGPQGAQGPQGTSGQIGAQGQAGPAGAPGPQGLAGPAGAQGGVGPVGPPGNPGPAGAPGAPGPAGPTGPASADSRFGTTNFTALVGDTSNGCLLGEVRLFAGLVATGLPAEGQLLPINQNQALFSLFGTTYGGDGTTTFGIPDLRGSAPNGTTYAICNAGIYPSVN